MRSIRSRLGLAVCALVVPLSLAVAVLLVTEQWRRSLHSGVDRAATLAVSIDTGFSDTHDASLPELGVRERALVLDGSGVVVHETEGFTEEFHNFVGVEPVQLDISSITAETLLWGRYTDGKRAEWSYAVVRCTDRTLCDAVIAAVAPLSWWSFMVGRLGWIALAVALSALLAWFGARWLVGRSLRPVEQMRAELDAVTATDLKRRVDVPATGDELQALGVSLNGTVARIEQAIASQQRFVSDAAHELRSPLSGVRATLELASMQPERTTSALSTAIGEVDRAAVLIDDLLDLARRDGGAPKPAAAMLVDLDEVVRSELRTAQTRRPSVEFAAGSIEPAQVRAVAADLSRLIRNLLDNAALHGAHRVRVGCVRRGTVALVIVDDDGPGIPVVDRERVFERFARLDASRSRSTGGTGLGLAIVSGIAQESGGTVTIGDASLGGASFVVTLPLASPDVVVADQGSK